MWGQAIFHANTNNRLNYRFYVLYFLDARYEVWSIGTSISEELAASLFQAGGV
jgi:hypothetical protein